MTDRRGGRETWTGRETAVLAAAAALGIFWRLRGLGGQLLLDDEWHALNFVLGKPFFSLFFRQGVGANSIPVNLYDAFLYRTFGWSETLLRLPSLLAGIAALIALPVLVRRLWGARVAGAFAFLLAFSPLAVFYSRNTRPYSAVLLFGFAAVLCALLWRKERRGGWGWAYMACGFVAVAHHLLAAIPVFAPLAVFGAESLAGGEKDGAAPSLREAVFAGLVMSGALAAALLPANLSNPWWLHVGHADHPTLRTFLEAQSLASGSAALAARLLFGLAAAGGLAVLFRKDRSAARVFAGAGAAYLAEAALSGQEGSHAAIQLVRYGIALLPALFALAAVALDELLGARFFPAGAAVFLGGLFWAGPLARIYGGVSNFAHHSAFQYDYAPPDWSRSRERELYRGLSTARADLNPCYDALARDADVKGLVEYPVLVGDHLDVLYYAQHFHGKPVAGGYRTGLRFPPLPSRDDFVYGDTPLDYVLSRVPPEARGRLRFSSLADVGDAAGLRERFPGWAVAVHESPLHEAFPARYPDAAAYPPALETERGLRESFGPPLCESGSIRAFRIR